MDYAENATIESALQEYFQRYNLGDGGYEDKNFLLSVFGLFAIPVPNTKGRIAAVKLHDVHHILTNIDANIRGESEIGAWELAAGCGKYPAAWILNLGALSYGMLFWPRRVIRAFMRGCASDSLYHGVVYDARLRNKTVYDLRHELGIKQEVRYSFPRLLLYVGYGLLALAPAIAVLGIGAMLLT
jgi:hypothetical protein